MDTQTAPAPAYTQVETARKEWEMAQAHASRQHYRVTRAAAAHLAAIRRGDGTATARWQTEYDARRAVATDARQAASRLIHAYARTADAWRAQTLAMIAAGSVAS